MYKKCSIILSVFLIIFLLASCSTKQKVNEEVEELSSLIGLKKEEVFEKLSLRLGENVASFRNPSTGVYVFNDERKMYGESVDLTLNFDISNDKMYGFTYRKEIAGDLEDGYNLVKKLYQSLLKDLNEPDTYPILATRISNMPNFDDLDINKLSENYREEWKLDNGLTVTLKLHLMPDTGSLVTLQYAELGKRNE